MKVGIVGNYGNNNQGDEAILEGVLVQVEEAYKIDRSEIIVFTNNPLQTHEKYGVQTVNLFQRRKLDPAKFLATIIHNTPIIRGLDVLLMGGGGILMDLYRNNPIVYGMYSLTAKLAKTPIVIFGPGVGPIDTFIGKTIIKSIANHAAAISVRDQESKELLHSIGVDKSVSVISDPALFIPAPQSKLGTKVDFQIGVTAVPYFNKNYWPKEDREKYSSYIKGMARNLDKLLEEVPSSSVNFFSTKHPHDTEVTKDIKQLMVNKERCTICDEGLNHRGILEFVNKQDLVIGTRLHSLILSLVAKTPIIGVAYHPKVKDFMNSIGCSENVIPIENVDNGDEIFLNLYNEMNQDWAGTVRRFEMILDDMKTREPQGATLLKDFSNER